MSTSNHGEHDAPADPQVGSFDDLEIDPRVRAAITDVGYETPSPIQAATIPPLMDGRDVVGLAQTGTGKTAAFAIPILSRLDTSARTPQALILAPTRELALQVSEAFGKYSAHMPEVKVLPIYGGQSYGVQLAGLRRGAQVIVGTPGRVIDHLDRKTLDISGLEFLVLDEADEMLTMGFAEDVERILAETPDTKQVALFSATMPSAIRRLAQKYLNSPQEITVKSKTATAQNITQRYLQVSHQRKLDALTRFLEVETFDAMIVFVRTKQATEELAEKLRSRGFSAVAINGDLAQAQRERTINQLKNGSIDILVATDVAARGLDVDRISHVVNYDIPHDTESYVHRIGRTGRAGRSGNALLFVSPRERHLLRAIERATRQTLTEIGLPSVDDVNAQRVAKFADSITQNLSSDNLDLFRGLIENYARDNDVAMADIAAALALETRDGGFLMTPDPPQSEKRPERERAPRRPGASFATYRIAVGRKHKVSPGAIVGAIANEGGLTRADFGNISIRDDFSLVELPDDLDNETLSSLRHTKIGKNPIDIRKDMGAPRTRGGAKRGAGGHGGGRDGRRGDNWGKRPSPRVAGRGRHS
ncbi:DEAD/DEAH box helicase [Gordonia sp. JH63]|uniref:ATP-dependent RNA helicase DeaD n=1 Tax=Gordonia hongkongensis TaxID=1701090 RepID=A0AAX3TCZ2_9ACTN|nr:MULTISPECIES: DEAD/DEAH box helicase [Gordonia]OCW85968.1 cold-shock protein [Nocardia farcinica]QIK48480.1 DEAD/DEAH box helicase [Gordonia terrae]MBN0971882.1 DEAD/DEAH box helicase [Gordonia sp. BP-119]MBN0981592.1 DEAD/DEAH box helicase [Gordonia sp. BP-94]MDF6102317.1 DEAD/DEAH box helicase [Gordonia hongkongensis]